MNWAKGVPDGLLVFFPSYTVLAACVDFWKSGASSGGGMDTVWERMTRVKLAVIEPRVRKTHQHDALQAAIVSLATLGVRYVSSRRSGMILT